MLSDALDSDGGLLDYGRVGAGNRSQSPLFGVHYFSDVIEDMPLDCSGCQLLCAVYLGHQRTMDQHLRGT
jgi:hypothetical protein